MQNFKLSNVDGEREIERTSGQSSIHVFDVRDSEYGEKALIESSYAAKNTIKGLDWDETHRSWDGAYWSIDVDALEHALDVFVEDGFEPTLTAPVAQNALE